MWLAKAADHAIQGRAGLVGGAAVNMHTQSYRPTDVDMCAYLDEADRVSLTAVGFERQQGDHFSFVFDHGEQWLLEFPSSQVDGDVSILSWDDGENLEVISLESLIVHRLLQATDRTRVTTDEALRLMVSVFDRADWARVEHEVRERDRLAPKLRVRMTFENLRERAARLVASAESPTDNGR